LNVEYTGLQEELMLYLKWGRKYVGQYADIRVSGSDGFPWTRVDYEAITDDYGIELKGTRGLVHKNMLAQRMVSVLPMIIGVLNNPAPGSIQVLSEALKKMDVPLDLEAILREAGAPMGPTPSLPGMEGEMLGGPGAPTLQNQQQAVTGALPQAAGQIGFGV